MTFKKILNKIGGFFAKYKIVAVLIILCAVISMTSEVFFSERNITNVLRQISTTCIIASGFTIILTSGNMDLSVGSVMAVSSLVMASLMKMGVPVPLAILICLLCGALAGFITGTLITSLKINAFIATLAIGQAYRGIAWLYSDGVPIFQFPDTFTWLGKGRIGIVPVPVIIMFVTCFIVYIILNKTIMGRNFCAIGGNKQAARVSGINERRATIQAFIITGVFAALAGVVMTARLDQARPDAGVGMEMDCIAAVVIGGTALHGGRGTVFGTFIGCLIIGIIENGLTINGVSPHLTKIAKGLLILVAITGDSIGTMLMNRRARIAAATVKS